MFRTAAAARRLGIHSQTLRLWADSGRVPFVWVGSERRFRSEDLDAFTGVAEARTAVRREALYVRVSGSTGQGLGLAAQERELRDTARGDVVAVFKDRASGLRENRPGLQRLLRAAGSGEFTVVRVVDEDRLARFGSVWLVDLLARDGVTVEVLHAKPGAGGMDELLADFMSLVASFAGRMYGMRSRQARARLLGRASDRLDSVR